jgi:hypothetical protein
MVVGPARQQDLRGGFHWGGRLWDPLDSNRANILLNEALRVRVKLGKNRQIVAGTTAGNRVCRIRQGGWYFSGDAVRFCSAATPPGASLTKRQPKREFCKPSRSLIDICHMRCDDEVRR